MHKKKCGARSMASRLGIKILFFCKRDNINSNKEKKDCLSHMTDRGAKYCPNSQMNSNQEQQSNI